MAARMDGQIEQEVKDKRAELVMQIQTGIMAQKQAGCGPDRCVLCDGIDEENGLYFQLHHRRCRRERSGVCVSSEEPLYPGQFAMYRG